MHLKLLAPTQLLLATACSTALAWTAWSQQDAAPESVSDAAPAVQAAQRLQQDVDSIQRQDVEEAGDARLPAVAGWTTRVNPVPGAQARTLFPGNVAQWRVGQQMDPRSERKIRELSEAIRQSDDDSEKEELKDQLQEELEAQYDAYLEQLEAPLAEMESRLEKLRAELEKRKANRNELVKLRLDTIWYDANGMGWPNSRNPLSVTGQYFPAVQGTLYRDGVLQTAPVVLPPVAAEPADRPDAPRPTQPAEPLRRSRSSSGKADRNR